MLRDLRPVHNVPECFEIIRALVLVLKIVGMFPNIAAQNWSALAAGDRLAHQRIVLIRGGANLQLAAIGDEPYPAGSETSQASRFKLFLEGIKAAKRAVDSFSHLSRRCAASFWSEQFPEK